MSETDRNFRTYGVDIPMYMFKYVQYNGMDKFPRSKEAPKSSKLNIIYIPILIQHEKRLATYMARNVLWNEKSLCFTQIQSLVSFHEHYSSQTTINQNLISEQL